MSLPLLPADAIGLAAALAVGLIIGLQRGWHHRELPEGARVAGLRTFALAGLLGGVLAHLQPQFGPGPLAWGVAGVALLAAVSYVRAARTSGDLSATTAVALLLTYALGAFAAHGDIVLALAAAVVTAVLLNLKPTLHGWLRRLEAEELAATLQLAVLSMVILPFLPDRPMGPYGALNPYQLWWAVILIAGLSLLGHFAMHLSGPQRGLLLTGLLGGLASSTAATLTLSRHARQQPAMVPAAGAAILAACGVMFLRMAVLLAVVQPVLLTSFGLGLLASGAVLLALGGWQWRHLRTGAPAGDGVGAMSPFDLGTALSFGAFLAVMAVLVPAARQGLGSGGVYGVAALSGLADVDAIVISLARAHGSDGLAPATTLLALGLATLANMLSKAAIAWFTGGARLGAQVARGYALALAAGAAALLLAG